MNLLNQGRMIFALSFFGFGKFNKFNNDIKKGKVLSKSENPKFLEIDLNVLRNVLT